MRRDAAFWVGCSGIVFQLALTRLASATLDYHLTFLVVAAAMLGGACGGVWVAGWVPAGTHAQDRRLASRACLLAALAQAATVALGSAVALGAQGPTGILAFVAVWFLLVALSYGASSGAMALMLRAAPEVGSTYALDLAGAACGCLAGLAVMQVLGPPAAVVVSVALVGVAAVRLSGSRWRAVWSGAPALLLAAAGAAAAWQPNVPSSKPLAAFLDSVRYPDAALELTRWDAFARVDVFRAPGAPLLWQPAPGHALDLPELRGITLDADALTAVARLEPDQDLPAAALLPASLPFQVAPRRRVLVIGPGGGLDVAAALTFGATAVDAVEVSPAVIQVMRGPLAELSGGLYARPGVHLVLGEGRSFLRRTTQRYDAIVLTAVDSWAALASGAYSLAESYLYTREAVGTMYDHLSDGGVLAISRWFSRPPREMDRLVTLARSAMVERGAPPERALLLQQAGDFGTLLVRRGEFSDAEVARARMAARQNGFSLAYDPWDRRGAFAPAVTQPSNSDVLPSDNRPYFFDFTPWRSLVQGGNVADLPRGHAVLLLALVESSVVVIGALALPLRRIRPHLGLPRQARWTGYFALLGAGFIAVELVFQQRMTLVLGHPVLALAVTLGGTLGGAAAGSALTRTPVMQGLGALAPAVAAVLLGVYALGLAPLDSAILGWAWLPRSATALGLVALPAVCMGTALPLGLARLPSRVSVPWAWGINGAASGLGATLATMAAMEWGLSAVLAGAAACYLLAAVLLGRRSGHFQ